MPPWFFLCASVAKGNLESLDDVPCGILLSQGSQSGRGLIPHGVPAPIFFILKAKCEVTAAALGVTMGEMVLVQSRAWVGKKGKGNGGREKGHERNEK